MLFVNQQYLSPDQLVHHHHLLNTTFNLKLVGFMFLIPWLLRESFDQEGNSSMMG